MATITLILGESGTGKTASLRNFKAGEIALVNVAGKPLPFKARFETFTGTDYRKIWYFMKATKAKKIVIDDFQYIMSFQYMHRLKENGWDKFNEIQSDFFNLIEMAQSLPDDTTVYFLSHLETKEDGKQKIKTIGKMLDEKITIEGMFTTVLKTYVADEKYYFLTQNSGNDTVKSPMGMFPTMAIDNDLKYVDDKIRNYYEIGDFKSDSEMELADSEAKSDEIQRSSNGRIKRASRTVQSDETKEIYTAAAIMQTEADNEAENDESVEVEQEVKEEQKEPQTGARQRRERKQRESDEKIPF